MSRTTPGSNSRTLPDPGIVVIASSAGGLNALRFILGTLPHDFPSPIVLVHHRAVGVPSVLSNLLRTWTNLAVLDVTDGMTLEGGTIYVAPADLHVTVNRQGRLHLADGSRIRGVLSSANPLMETAAEVYDGRVVAVVLTGTGRDATDGVQAVRLERGLVIVQDPSTAEYPAMPRSAIETGAASEVLPLEMIGPELCYLAGMKSHMSLLADLRRHVVKNSERGTEALAADIDLILRYAPPATLAWLAERLGIRPARRPAPAKA